MHKILLHVDGTEQSIVAAQFSICLAKSLGAQLYAQYIVNKKALDDLFRAKIFLLEEEEEYEHDLQHDAEKYLNLVKDYAAKKNIAVQTIQSSGNVVQEIIATVKNENITILVMGELSRIRSRRDEFYNENERVMRTVPCSVLIVKDPESIVQQYNAL